MPSQITALEDLSQRVREELSYFEYPLKDWVTPRRGTAGETVQNVVVVGGGQTGLTIAFGLQRERISNVMVIDESPEGLEGPWITYARMITLRTLKFLTGPDLGFVNLTFRAWHEAQFGKASWENLVRIHKDEWMRYLVWFRGTLNIPVRNGVRLLRIEPRDGFLALHLGTPEGGEVVLTRKLVMATGIEGAGQRRIPDFVRAKLPAGTWAHTSDRIDFESLRGKRVAVMGAGASAFDNAATALEHGAARVDIFVRRTELSMVNSFRALESAGFWRNFGDMDDANRWRFMRRLLSMPMPPPQDTLDRTLRFANASVHYGSPILDTSIAPDGIRLRIPSGWHEADFLILGTGFAVDLRLRPELAGIAEHAAMWSDRYTPPPDLADTAIGLYPYLGSAFQLTEKTPGTLPALRDIHLFNIGGVVSTGPVAGGLNGMPYGVPRLLAGLSRDLFRTELDELYAEFAEFEEPDAWETFRAASD